MAEVIRRKNACTYEGSNCVWICVLLVVLVHAKYNRADVLNVNEDEGL